MPVISTQALINNPKGALLKGTGVPSWTEVVPAKTAWNFIVITINNENPDLRIGTQQWMTLLSRRNLT